VLLQPEQELELRERKQFLPPSQAANVIIEPQYINSVYAKVRLSNNIIIIYSVSLRHLDEQGKNYGLILIFWLENAYCV